LAIAAVCDMYNLTTTDIMDLPNRRKTLPGLLFLSIIIGFITLALVFCILKFLLCCLVRIK